MDIAKTPEAAAPATTIHREDYRPPDWLVPEIALDFALGLDETAVTAKLAVRRNPAAADQQARLRLHGDGIAARAVRVDGKAVNDWTMGVPTSCSTCQASSIASTLRP
jgi:aminopeptidase N